MAFATTPDVPYRTGSGQGWTHWAGWDYVPGLAFIVVGVLALTQQPVASLATSLALAAIMCVGGAFALIGGVINIRHRGGWLVALLGVLSLAVGLFVLSYPVVGAVSLMWTIGLWLVVGAFFEIGIAFSVPTGRGWLFLVGAVDLVLGVLIVMMGPFEAFAFLGFYVGISFLARGLWSVVYVAELHHMERNMAAA